MNPGKELREILGHVKDLLAADREIGLDPPPILRSVFQDPGKEAIRSSPLEDLGRSLEGCRRCKLSENRTRVVFGEGSSTAKLVFVGEGPGKAEDQAGRPFVGEAGKLLTKIIEKGMGLNRGDVYICNVVKCRPPNNRDPERDEIRTCLPFLKQQLQLIGPDSICTLGRIAARELLGKDFKITQERGKWQRFMGIPLMPTFHPAYILRNPTRERELKGLVWKDVQEIMVRLGLEVKKNV